MDAVLFVSGPAVELPESKFAKVCEAPDARLKGVVSAGVKSGVGKLKPGKGESSWIVELADAVPLAVVAALFLTVIVLVIEPVMVIEILVRVPNAGLNLVQGTAAATNSVGAFVMAVQVPVDVFALATPETATSRKAAPVERLMDDLKGFTVTGSPPCHNYRQLWPYFANLTGINN